MKDLAGKVAVVTGAASGIGRALAERFAREKMSVVLADVDEKGLAVATDAIAKTGARAIGVRCDTSKAAEVDALAAEATSAFGAVHVVCNNAGVAVGAMMWERDIADWEWVLGVNLWGVIHGIRAFVPRMIAQGEGHVVNTASIAGLMTAAGMGPYCATKHAVVAMSECLHHDLVLAAGGKVNVSVLCPGWVKTAIASSERNRPAQLKTPPRELRPHEQMIADATRSAVEHGMPPEEVAGHVVSAIREERFYVITHPKMMGAVKKRADAILSGGTPAWDPNFE
jgi:NAD(P)-dependent dehydrogenase (short-subunit alcohol dehydrogenase family)